MFTRRDDGEIADEWDIKCGMKDCYLEYGAEWYLSKDAAIEKWNTRYEEPK